MMLNMHTSGASNRLDVVKIFNGVFVLQPIVILTALSFCI